VFVGCMCVGLIVSVCFFLFVMRVVLGMLL